MGKWTRVKVVGDAATTGWMRLSDKWGVVFAEPAKYFRCTQSVAITDVYDINKCKVLKKLTEGEVFIAEEDPKKDEEAGVVRVKCNLPKDNISGWITIKGNVGTIFAVESNKNYNLLRDTELYKSKPSANESEKGTAVKKGSPLEMLEGPLTETIKPEARVRGRTLGDGKMGWMTLTDNVRQWSVTYTCLSSTPMQDAKSPEGAGLVREVKAGEVVELVEGPVVDAELVRMKAVARKDGS